MKKYEDIQPIGRDEAERVFAEDDVEETCRTMVAIALYDKDWKWVQDKCTHFFMSSNPDISGLAATCLGHICRIHRSIEKDKVVGILKSRMQEPAISGRIEDALQDIEMFG